MSEPERTTTTYSDEITPEMVEIAEREAERLTLLGLDCTPSDVLLATTISNMVKSAISLDPEIRTRATEELTRPTALGVACCVILARTIAEVREATTYEQQAGAMAKGIVGVIAALDPSLVTH